MLLIQDPFGRAIEYLRISVTDRCNLRCVYCMPEHGLPYEENSEILSADEILRIVRLLAANGLKKVRLTGGEPLVRARDVLTLVSEISRIPEIEDLSMTTNAVLLAQHAQALRDAGLMRINISLDTLQPERFAKITRFAKFEDAVAGLAAAEEAGFSPIKLNMVVMRGFNDDEIADFAAITFLREIHVRFLEYMPIGQVTPPQWRAKYISNEEVLTILEDRCALSPQEALAASTARVFRMRGARGTIGVISPISHRFCEGCNRLRLTANGALVPCLSDNFEYDLKGPLRAGESDADLLEHVRRAVSNKPKQSDFEGRLERGGSLRIMAQIGG